MGFFDLFRRPKPIRDTGELAEFIDRHAAFVTQKGIYEYARARAGHYAKVLFKEPEFQAACDVSRWRAFPLGLAMVGELVEGVLRPLARGEEYRQREPIGALVLAVFDRYPVPAELGEAAWRELRAELDRHLKQVGLHPPKWAKDIPVPFAKSYFDLMPIHEKLRTAEFPTITNYLRVTLCNIHDEFSGRADAAALGRALSSPESRNA
jgi:hypothetical protein